MNTDRDMLLQQAIALRAHRRIGQAMAVLAELERGHPSFSRLHQERGHCHIVNGDARAAIAALTTAVRLNPTLPASWDMLAQLHRMAGDIPQAQDAAQRRALLGRLPPASVVANSLFVDGDLPDAEQVIRAYLIDDAANAGARRLLARIRIARGDPGEAEALLERLLDETPDYQDARNDLALLLLQQQRYAAARSHADMLLRHDPDRRDYLKHYAAACIGQGDHEPTIDIYARLLAHGAASGAEVADLRLWRANALKIAGRQQEAISDYRASLAARPDYAVAWFALANLKTHRFTDDDLTRLQAAAARTDLSAMDYVYLSFALGKALEDRGDHAGSWQHYAQGNARRSMLGRYCPDATDAVAARLVKTFTPAFLAARSGWGMADPAPIFILGLPRSGSTLVEQILASHPQVEGTQELTEIGDYAAALCGRDPDTGLPHDPDAIRAIDAGAARALGERFLSETAPYRRLGRPFFIDKMPNNFWHVGLIHLILPRATIIDIRREPMACCFGNLKQLFGGANQPFAYDPAHIARYYRTYLSVMRHWDAVLPGRVLRVRYEDLVENPDGEMRRMLAHCGLPFDDACLSFHETRRSIRTPSSEQVRRPISRDGLAQWRHYAAWLGPMEAVLGDAMLRYRD